MKPLQKKNGRSHSVRRWVLPGADSWMERHVGNEGSSAMMPVSGPEQGGGDVFVWPFRDVAGLPLWLAGKDEVLFRELAPLQMEKRGLMERSWQPGTLSVASLESSGDRSLVQARALAKKSGELSCPSSARRYLDPVDVYSWPGSCLVLLKELGEWVGIFVGTARPVLVLPLGTGELGISEASELACTGEALANEGVCPGVKQVVLWDEATMEEQEALSGRLGLPLQQAARPLPLFDRAEDGVDCLLPPHVAARRKQREASRRAVGFMLAVAAVVVLVLGGWGARLAWMHHRIGGLEKEAASLAPRAAASRQVAEDWRVLQASTEPDLFAMSKLLACSSRLPEKGVRFTQFEIKDGVVTITGEAGDSSMAFGYSKSLENPPLSPLCRWVMDSPNIQPNNSVQFTIKGDWGHGG